MQYEEERIAKQLFEAMHTRLKHLDDSILIEIEGEGVHWSCSVALGERSCVVDCFEGYNTPRAEAEYYIEFAASENDEATGRTEKADDILAAVQEWLQGCSLTQLHDRHAFVDDGLRQLQQMERGITARYPAIDERTSHGVRTECGDIHELWFETSERSCKISFYGDSGTPDVVFMADGSDLFQTQSSETEEISTLVNQWLVDCIPPTTIHSAHTEITLGPAARCYEEGRLVEGEFIQSWDDTEQIYKEIDPESSSEIIEYIHLLRSKGFDRTLRAGSSLLRFIVSRSRRDGLTEDQPYIMLVFEPDALCVATGPGQRESLSLAPFTFPRELETLFRELEQTDID